MLFKKSVKLNLEKTTNANFRGDPMLEVFGETGPHHSPPGRYMCADLQQDHKYLEIIIVKFKLPNHEVRAYGRKAALEFSRLSDDMPLYDYRVAYLL